ncbi:MAG TPA: antibiotic biosynthesis monooxygenase [Acidimicrobiales bacterium]
MSDSTGADGPRIVTVFRSRLRPESVDEYHHTAQRILDLARTMPGFVEFKAFEADDGERVSIVTFESRETHRAWRDHPEHRDAQQMGRDRFYSSYDISVCEVLGESHFPSR